MLMAYAGMGQEALFALKKDAICSCKQLLPQQTLFPGTVSLPKNNNFNRAVIKLKPRLVFKSRSQLKSLVGGQYRGIIISSSYPKTICFD